MVRLRGAAVIVIGVMVTFQTADPFVRGRECYRLSPLVYIRNLLLDDFVNRPTT